jgi:KipI family sensor histidine kinase inhibitor
MPVKIHRVGADALLAEVDDPAAWFVALTARQLDVVDIVPGARTILLDGLADPDAVAEALPGWAPSAGPATVEPRLVEVPISYGGPDLEFVAAHWDVSGSSAIEFVASIEFTVAFCGFSPGFAYLTGLPDSHSVPRLADPRPSVPAGSLALAGEFAGIYPTASPGGWRLIGRTDVALFDVAKSPPALLTPGTRVRLVPC